MNAPAKEFAKRLRQACDDSFVVPEYGKGRQVAIAKHMKCTQEAVRKWFEGEAMPKPQKMRRLATFLDVDEGWLALGIKPDMDKDDRKRISRITTGAIHFVTGLIMMEGGNVAFPRDDDPRSEYVDLYVIMHGAQAAIHVCPVAVVDDKTFEAMVPRQYADVRCVGFVSLGGGKYHLIDLPTNAIEQLKRNKAGDYALTIKREGSQYRSDSYTWPRFNTFGDIL